MKISLVILALSINLSLAEEKKVIPEGKITSPYEACQKVTIVSKAKYLEKRHDWEQFEKTCNINIQLSADAGISSLDPLKEGLQYLNFSQRVAKKIIENLEKSREYADCSSKCFSGAVMCTEDKKNIQCDKRKKDIQSSMKVYARKIRMELALSNDAPGLVNVNLRNVLTVEKDKFINSNLRDFEMGLPNPLGRMNITEREQKEAMRRSTVERERLEQEFKEKGYTNYNDWMSVKLMQNFDEHRSRYRSLVYEEAPIFGVIDRPVKFEYGSEPVWNDSQIELAFRKLSDNSKATQRKINNSLNNSKLEFSRYNGEALAEWMSSIAPGKDENNDLLYYIGMKNQVEEVLKEDPGSCGIATAMHTRLNSKEMQNTGITFTATLLSSGIVKGATSIFGNLFKIGRALTSAEAMGLTGMALGTANLSDSFAKYATITTEAATKSGLANNDEEGSGIRKSENITDARDGVKTSLIFAPLDVIGGWSVGKTLYSSLSRQIARDIPEISSLIKSTKISPVVRDQLVDQWLVKKVQSAFKSGTISEIDKIALESKETQAVLTHLTSDIEKANPEFFKNSKNMDFYLKTAATMVRKNKGDPSDLGVKTKELLLRFNTEAMNGSWDPKAQSGLLKVFDNAIEELRLSAKNDPATYAKFTTDPKSQEKIILSALKKSGVSKDADAKDMLQCAF